MAINPTHGKVVNQADVSPRENAGQNFGNQPATPSSKVARKVLTSVENNPTRVLDAVAVLNPSQSLQENPDAHLLPAFERSLRKNSTVERAQVREEEAQKFGGIFANTHFDPQISESKEFKQFVQTNGLANVIRTVREIETRVAKFMRDDEFIANGMDMIKHSLEEGHRFCGVPELVGVKADGSPMIRWRESAVQTSSTQQDGLLCETRSLQMELDKTPQRAEFDSKREMHDAFDYFKRTLPTGHADDGCDMRCNWISYVLDNYYKVGYEKVKVSHLENKFFELQPPFDQKKVQWTMHTAPTVMCEGKEYIFDVSLNKPIEYDKWLGGLHPRNSDLKIETSSAWDIECRDDENRQHVDFKELTEDLRGLYLFENVDGNAFEMNGVTRRSRGWMSWVESERGFAPVASQNVGDALALPVLVDFKNLGDNKFAPVFENRVITKDYCQHESGIYFKDEGLQRKYLHYQRLNRLAVAHVD